MDAIRGLAAMAVMIYHLKPQAFALHGVRVDLFLILSGYLLTSIILKKGDGARFLFTFSVRRWLRLWPTYFIAIMLLVLVNPWLSKPFPMDGLPYYLTFTQNVTRYWSNTIPAFCWYFEHTWSLAIEEQFFLFWPVMVMLLGRRRLVPVALALVVMSVVMRSLGTHWWLLVARCDGFAFGSVLAAIFLEREQVERHRAKIQLGLSLTSLFAVGFVVATTTTTLEMDFSEMSLWPSLMVLSWNLLYFGLIGLVILNTGHPSLRILRDPRLGYLGKVSYGIYLFHSFVFVSLWALGRYLHWGEPVWLDVAKIVLTIVVASISWHWIEQPIANLKDRFRYEPVRTSSLPLNAHRFGGVRA
ncbi:acyltransferase family protein [Singulisphaera acidiphila]|uniref:acyltransferase family protein n=1 Tax=Singulisphaera acidiphila TaxID=466153 RepID=UPI001ED9701B|nr:acyltransferase [Singulisphaera acidiphila]